MLMALRMLAKWWIFITKKKFNSIINIEFFKKMDKVYNDFKN